MESKGLASPKVEFHFMTLFPEMFGPILRSSLLGKAQQSGKVSYHMTSIRDFATDKHRTVDDTPFGGSEGMLLKADVLYSAWKSIVGGDLSSSSPDKDHIRSEGLSQKTLTLLLSPQGELFNQRLAQEVATTYSKVILVCGHYEGVDERFIELCVDREVSIGDYVLTGGELPAMVVADTVTRLIPGVVGYERSISEDSLEGGLLKYPQYTRPRAFMDLEVPPVLLSGNHKAIQAWRRLQMLKRTQEKRPDLWAQYEEAQKKGSSRA